MPDCKPCFRQRYPDLFIDKQRRLRAPKKTCGVCGMKRQLQGGFCGQCRSARGFSADVDPPVRRQLVEWCAGSHSPPKPARSGFRGSDGMLYCFPCYRFRFPALYQAKQLLPKKWSLRIAEASSGRFMQAMQGDKMWLLRKGEAGSVWVLQTMHIGTRV